MIDGQWRTLAEISAVIRCPEASVSARLRDLRKNKFGGYLVERRRRGAERRGLFEYRVCRPITQLPRKADSSAVQFDLPFEV
jgi:hypothetical protein